ncbi:MAG: acyltransferase [Paraburkholderia sp.]|nr:MAG: acyltransferase [Paraburkholderia sp.]
MLVVLGFSLGGEAADMEIKKMILAEALRRENNNADLMRLLAAFAVLWTHSYGLAPHLGVQEPIGSFLGFDQAGPLGVKFFFFLSGILVTNSWLTRQSPIRFALARFFRIFPALLLSATFCIFVIGPVFSSIPLAQYFSNTETFTAVFLAPYREYLIPGLFSSNPIKYTNGAIWTIRYELAMYILLLALGMLGLFKHKVVSTVFLVAVMAESFVFPNNITFISLSNVNVAGYLPGFFAFGALFAVHKNSIAIDAKLVIGCALIAAMCIDGPGFRYAFWAAFLVACLWAMTLPALRKLRLPGDFSYGVYVFAWPIQQCLAQVMPHSVLYAHQTFTFLLSLLCAMLSWYAVEKPCMQFGRLLADSIDLIMRRGPREKAVPIAEVNTAAALRTD